MDQPSKRQTAKKFHGDKNGPNVSPIATHKSRIRFEEKMAKCNSSNLQDANEPMNSTANDTNIDFIKHPIRRFKSLSAATSTQIDLSSLDSQHQDHESGYLSSRTQGSFTRSISCERSFGKTTTSKVMKRIALSEVKEICEVTTFSPEQDGLTSTPFPKTRPNEPSPNAVRSTKASINLTSRFNSAVKDDTNDISSMQNTSVQSTKKIRNHLLEKNIPLLHKSFFSPTAIKNILDGPQESSPIKYGVWSLDEKSQFFPEEFDENEIEAQQSTYFDLSPDKIAQVEAAIDAFWCNSELVKELLSPAQSQVIRNNIVTQLRKTPSLNSRSPSIVTGGIRSVDSTPSTPLTGIQIQKSASMFHFTPTSAPILRARMQAIAESPLVRHSAKATESASDGVQTSLRDLIFDVNEHDEPHSKRHFMHMVDKETQTKLHFPKTLDLWKLFGRIFKYDERTNGPSRHMRSLLNRSINTIRRRLFRVSRNDAAEYNDTQNSNNVFDDSQISIDDSLMTVDIPDATFKTAEMPAHHNSYDSFASLDTPCRANQSHEEYVADHVAHCLIDTDTTEPSMFFNMKSTPPRHDQSVTEDLRRLIPPSVSPIETKLVNSKDRYEEGE